PHMEEPDSAYWCSLRFEDQTLGCGFLVSSGVVLTAAHCLATIPPAKRTIDVHFANRAPMRARIEEIDVWDLALLIIQDPNSHGMAPPPADACRAGEGWVSPHRPTNSDPRLGGVVT